MTKESNYIGQIFDLIEENPHGMTVTDIANELNISRNTVYRYIGILEGKQKVYSKKIGNYTLYYPKTQLIFNKDIFLSFFKGLLANLKEEYPNQHEIFKSMGRRIGKSMDVPLKRKGKKIVQQLDKMSKIEILESVTDYMPYFNILNDTITISKINIKRNKKKAIVTFINSEMLGSSDEYIYYFYLLMGLIEEKLSEYIGREIRFDILAYETFQDKEQSYIKFSYDFKE